MSYDANILNMLNDVCSCKPRELTIEQKAHNLASIVAAPFKIVDGKFRYSKSIAQANYKETYDMIYGMLSKKKDHA